MISRLCLLAFVSGMLSAPGAQAGCEESSRSVVPGGEEFFLVCQSHKGSPLQYVLTKFISDQAVHGVLSFRAGKKGFFCARRVSGNTTCHASNFGLLPVGRFQRADGYEYEITNLQQTKPMKNPEVSYPRGNRIDTSSGCYLGVKNKSILLGIDPEQPYGVSNCIVVLEEALPVHL